MSNHYYHELLLPHDLMRLRLGTRCNAEVRIGILELHQSAKQYRIEHQKAPSKRIIESLMRRYVDRPVKKWLKKYGAKELSFSKMLSEYGVRSTAILSGLYQQYEDQHGWIVANEKFVDLAPTVDILIDLANFHNSHVSDHQKLVAFITTCSSAGASYTEIKLVDSKRRALQTTMSKRGLHPMLDFSSYSPENRHCQLCARLTEQAEELIRIFEHPEQIVSRCPEADALIGKHGTRFQTKGFSTDYCSVHSPTQSTAEYRKAIARIEQYYGLQRMMILIRQSREFRNRLPHAFITRHASYAFVDACPDRALVREISDLMERWASMSHRHSDLLDLMTALFQRIARSLRAEGDRLAPLAFAYLEKESNEIADLALELEIVTHRELVWLNKGFIVDPLSNLLNAMGQKIDAEKI
ncbi:hypothetical protein [Duganella sp. HH101]|uniref:hypothetical protein n=1 Tax=Duganella sp. HH101 TaxID=1781066 RepID=UPI00114CC94F|nr:hypothetical protein [Duganella sp. HH101]